MIHIKRVYDPPANHDGRRVLVERLWPRGIRKDALRMDAWLKDVAPSTELRKWYGHLVPRWEEFRRLYMRELSAKPAALTPLVDAARQGELTLLYSARDVEHNAAVVLRDYLTQQARRARRRRRRAPAQSPRQT